jgi:hypothetical protein
MAHTSVATLSAPLVTVLATPVATETTSEVTSEKTLAAPLVISESMESTCAEAKDAAMNGKMILERRIFVIFDFGCRVDIVWNLMLARKITIGCGVREFSDEREKQKA